MGTWVVAAMACTWVVAAMACTRVVAAMACTWVVAAMVGTQVVVANAHMRAVGFSARVVLAVRTVFAASVVATVRHSDAWHSHARQFRKSAMAVSVATVDVVVVMLQTSHHTDLDCTDSGMFHCNADRQTCK